MCAFATMWARYAVIAVKLFPSAGRAEPLVKNSAERGVIAQQLEGNSSMIWHIAIANVHFDLACHTLSTSRGSRKTGRPAATENGTLRFRETLRRRSGI